MKKNYFLRILSIAFVICMAVALLPTVFASDTGVTVTYPMWQGAYGSTKFEDIAYENAVSAGRLEYLCTTSTRQVAPTWGLGVVGMLMEEDEYAAYKIRVPKTDDYTITLDYGVGPAYTQGEMYIIPASVGTEGIAAHIAQENPVMTVNFNGLTNTLWTDFDNYYNKNSAGTYTIPQQSTATTKRFVAGEYIVVWVGTGNTSTGIKDAYYLRPGTLTLAGNGNGRTVIYATASADKTKLDAAIGETCNIALGTVYMSDGAVATEEEKKSISFETESTAIEITGSEIKAVSEGTATVYAKCGDYILDEFDITVKDTPYSGVEVAYPMWQGAYTVKPGEITYANSVSAGRINYDSYTTTVKDFIVDGVATPTWAIGALNLSFNSTDEYFAYRIMVPKNGKYDVSVMFSTQANGTQGEMYIIPGNVTDIPSALEGEKAVLTINSNSDTYGGVINWTVLNKHWTGQTPSVTIKPATGKVVLEAGEHLVVWKGVGDAHSSSKRYTFHPATMVLDGGDATVINTAISAVNRVLSYDGTTTVTATGTLSTTGYTKTSGGAATFTYASSNPSVATVSADGTVTAKNGGVAKITATCTNAVSGNNSLSTMIVVDEPSNTVSFGADSNVNGVSITTNISGYTQGEVTSVSLETPVTVTAQKTVGDYVFRGWVRGSERGGRFISNETEYSFNAMKNTYLTAIYTLAADTEYYAWNGEFLGTEEPEEPEVLGYVFDEWKPSEDADVTRYVAQYTQAADEYNVTYNGVTNKYKFNDKVVLESNTAVYWYRNDKLVDYGTEYTFYVWDDATVKTSSEGHELPIVVLDAKVKDNNFMIEYDNAGKEIVEVGILFGNAGSVPTVSSCYENMNSQRENVSHGQFTARADQYTNARGYLIYRDNDDSFKVIYSE